MKNTKFEKYLGDVLMKQGSNKKNIEARVSMGIGIISQLMLLLEEIWNKLEQDILSLHVLLSYQAYFLFHVNK